jgi:hypothetical protein
LIDRLFKKETNLEHTRDPKYSSLAKEKLNRELDIIRLIKTIKKLKATVSCLVNERKDRDQLIESAKAINNHEMTVSIHTQPQSKFERFIDDSSSDENPETMVQSTTIKETTSLVQNNQTPSQSLTSEPRHASPLAHTELFKIQTQT